MTVRQAGGVALANGAASTPGLTATRNARAVPGLTPVGARIKRAFDVAVASCALLVSAPFVLAGGLAMRATSPGPMFFRARRAGLGEQPFDMFKVRTMRVGGTS